MNSYKFLRSNSVFIDMFFSVFLWHYFDQWINWTLLCWYILRLEFARLDSTGMTIWSRSHACSELVEATWKTEEMIRHCMIKQVFSPRKTKVFTSMLHLLNSWPANFKEQPKFAPSMQQSYVHINQSRTTLQQVSITGSARHKSPLDVADGPIWPQ